MTIAGKSESPWFGVMEIGKVAFLDFGCSLVAADRVERIDLIYLPTGKPSVRLAMRDGCSRNFPAPDCIPPIEPYDP